MKVIKECQNYQTQSFIIYFKLFVGMLEQCLYMKMLERFLKELERRFSVWKWRGSLDAFSLIPPLTCQALRTNSTDKRSNTAEPQNI